MNTPLNRHQIDGAPYIYGLCPALRLYIFGVTDFATANVKNFADTGFARMRNPLTNE